MPLATEADTCRKSVVPLLQQAGWDNEPHSIAEQRTITDGRIISVGKGFVRKSATRGVGARRERTRPEQFLAIPFSFPSIRAQERAIDMLKSVDALKVLQTETGAELDAMLPAMLDKAFKGDP